MAKAIRKKVKAGDVLLALTPAGRVVLAARAIAKAKDKKLSTKARALKLQSNAAKAALVRQKLADQRAKVQQIRHAVRNERNLIKKTALAHALHAELLKLQIMVWTTKGQKHKGAELIAVRGKQLAPVGFKSRNREVFENYVDYLLWSKGLSPRRHRFPPFNVNPQEAKAGLTPQLRQAQLEAAFIALGRQGRLKGKEVLAFQSLKPAPVAQKDAMKVLNVVKEITASAVTPERATPTDAASSAKVADSSIPADPAALTDADVDKALVDAETAEAQVAATGEVADEAAEEVADAADKPADAVVAEAEQSAVAAGGGMNLTTLGLIAAAAAGVYFFVLKK